MSVTKESERERWKSRSRLTLSVDRRDFGGPREFYSGEKRGVTGEVSAPDKTNWQNLAPRITAKRGSIYWLNRKIRRSDHQDVRMTE